MKLVFIHEVKSGNNYNLIIDTDKKIFKYFSGCWCSTKGSNVISVKTKKDIDRLVNIVKNDTRGNCVCDINAI